MLLNGNETPNSIATWASSTFGPAQPKAIVQRSLKEMTELLLEVSKSSPDVELLKKEATDVIIVLMRLFGPEWATGKTFQQYIDEKMQINRRRQWTIGPDGCGQHVPGT